VKRAARLEVKVANIQFMPGGFLLTSEKSSKVGGEGGQYPVHAWSILIDL